MKKIVLYTIFTLLVIACSKDKFDTTPTIKIKSVSASQVVVNENLGIDLEFIDKEGDLDSVIIRKIRLNSVQVQVTKPDVVPFPIPDFSSKSKGELRLNIGYNDVLTTADQPRSQPDAPNGKEPDTLLLKIVVKDKASHVSDTVATGPIVVERS